MNITHADEEISRLVSRAVAWWRDRLEAQAQARELADLPAQDRAELARDLALTPADLDMLAQDSRGGLLMERMAKACGVDLDEVRRTMPDVSRDMALGCARCGDKARCRHDMDAGLVDLVAPDYCPNAGTFRDLSPRL